MKYGIIVVTLLVMCSKVKYPNEYEIRDGIDIRTYYNIQDMKNSGFSEVTTVRNQERLLITVSYYDRSNELFENFVAVYESMNWLSFINEENIALIHKSLIKEYVIDTVEIGGNNV